MNQFIYSAFIKIFGVDDKRTLFILIINKNQVFTLYLNIIIKNRYT